MIGIIILILVLGLLFYIWNQKKDEKKENITPFTIKKEKKEENTEIKEEILYKVDIKGEVNAPGIYTLPSTSRVIDVIEASGGLTENADTSVINLSIKIIDEMVIIIYSKEQVNSFKETKELEETVQERCRQLDENSLQNDACISNNEQKSEKINLNTATKEELMSLNGIGESKANAIINYREQTPFQKIEDLLNIPGIGENIFAQIKENIIV